MSSSYSALLALSTIENEGTRIKMWPHLIEACKKQS